MSGRIANPVSTGKQVPTRTLSPGILTEVIMAVIMPLDFVVVGCTADTLRKNCGLRMVYFFRIGL